MARASSTSTARPARSAGIWFDETLPLTEVVDVAPSSWPWYGGLGVKLGPTANAVSVVGSTVGVLAIRFSQPAADALAGDPHRSELRVSVEDPEGLRHALAARDQA